MNLTSIFNEFNTKYFSGKLSSIPVVFYSRRSRTLGFFRYGSRAYISINLIAPIVSPLFKRVTGFAPAEEMNMKHTLLHEMVHAFLYVSKLPHGHSSLFKSMLKDLTEKEFGFRPTSNVRFAVSIPTHNAPKTAPVAPTVNVLPIPAPVTASMLRILTGVYAGKIGILVKDTNVYGRKYVILKGVEGTLFPLSVLQENVTPA